jgi:flagellar hook assembly protein FlgD
VDANGSLVFQGASDGTGPIVWDGKGRDGHVVPSGAYIAQIKQEDGQVIYQTLAIVK